MTISRYVLVDRDNLEGDHEYESYDEAVEAAGDDHAVIEREYEYSGDSDLVWTPPGAPDNIWPPKPLGEFDDLLNAFRVSDADSLSDELQTEYGIQCSRLGYGEEGDVGISVFAYADGKRVELWYPFTLLDLKNAADQLP